MVKEMVFLTLLAQFLLFSVPLWADTSLAQEYPPSKTAETIQSSTALNCTVLLMLAPDGLNSTGWWLL